MEASKPGTRSAKKAPPVLILALLSGTLFSFGHESNRPHRRHPAANIAEALCALANNVGQLVRAVGRIADALETADGTTAADDRPAAPVDPAAADPW